MNLKDTPLPSNLVKALAVSGITNTDQLVTWTQFDLLRIKGIGRKSMRHIFKFMGEKLNMAPHCPSCSCYSGQHFNW